MRLRQERLSVGGDGTGGGGVGGGGSGGSTGTGGQEGMDNLVVKLVCLSGL